MKFQDWVEKRGGMHAVAKELGYCPDSVRYWMLGRGAPKIDTVAKLLEIGRGSLTFWSIYRDTTENHKAHDQFKNLKNKKHAKKKAN